MSVDKPNVLFILVDQQRWDTVSCYGVQPNITPNLDRMADEGVRFKYAFTCQPVCGPARACLQTGKYPTEVRCHTNHRMLPTDEPTIARILSAHGYEVAYIGKWHLASFGPKDGPDDFRTKPVPPERRGGYKDYWLASDVLEHTSHAYDGHMFDGDMRRREFPKNRYRVDVLTDWAMEYLEKRTSSRPVFLFLSYIEPHHQNDHGHHEGPVSSKKQFGRYVIPGDLVDTEGDWRTEFPDYLGCINSLDQNLGRIREKIEDLGMTDDTLIIYTSDHGSHFCTRNREYKRSCHDASIRIPLILYGPGFSGGSLISDLVSLIDLPPTILQTAGLSQPEFMRGRPLNNLVNGETSEWPKDIFIQISESQCGRAIRTKKWKYSVTAPNKTGRDPDSDLYVEDFLYDLDNDPHERQNLILSSEHTEIREKMANLLKKRIAQFEGEVPKIDRFCRRQD